MAHYKKDFKENAWRLVVQDVLVRLGYKYGNGYIADKIVKDSDITNTDQITKSLVKEVAK